MFKHILIPTDGSDLSRKAMLYAMKLAKESAATVTALNVTQPYQAVSMDTVLVSLGQDEYEDGSKRLSERALEQVKIAADAANVPCDTISEVHDQPYLAIIDAAQQKGCDLIVMASHGRRGLAAMLLGSETSKVLTHSTIPVLVYR